MNEVGELQWIANKKDRSVVADQVVVAVLGVELDRKAARIAQRVGGALFTRDGREADENLGTLSDWREKFCPRPLRHVGQHFEVAVSTRAFGMHDALGNPLAIKMRELLDQVMVLHQNRSSRTRGPRVLIVGDRGSAVRC